jgi:predicted RNA-binding Zn ribbon-like protein
MSPTVAGDLETLRAFVNTYDPDVGDLVASPEALQTWLVEHSLLAEGQPVDGAGHRRALRLREAVRRLGMANHDGVPDPAAAEEADALARGCGLVVRLGEQGVASLEAAGRGIDAALARLLAILYTATVNGTWARFKVCRNENCRWAFYDRSKNRSGRFCGTACGNAVNARAYRRRKAAASATAD